MVDVLDTGAANLTDADMNEEAARLQALSTRQSLAISALSLANTVTVAFAHNLERSRQLGREHRSYAMGRLRAEELGKVPRRGISDLGAPGK